MPAQNFFEPSQNVGYLLLFFVDTLRKIQLQSEIKMKKIDNYISFSKSFTFDRIESYRRLIWRGYIKRLQFQKKYPNPRTK